MLNPNRFYDLEHRSMVARVPMHSTQEELQTMLSAPSVVIPYHSFVLAVWYSFNNKSDNHYSAAVYAVDGSSATTFHDNGKYACDAPVTLVYLYDREFSDMGDAMHDAIERAILIHADRLMNTIRKDV